MADKNPAFKQFIADVFHQWTQWIATQLDTAKEQLKNILRETPKEDHETVVASFLYIADGQRREQELVERAYQEGIKKVESDKKLLIAEIKKLKTENQEMAKVKKGLKQPEVEMSPVIPKPIEYR